MSRWVCSGSRSRFLLRLVTHGASNNRIRRAKTFSSRRLQSSGPCSTRQVATRITLLLPAARPRALTGCQRCPTESAFATPPDARHPPYLRCRHPPRSTRREPADSVDSRYRLDRDTPFGAAGRWEGWIVSGHRYGPVEAGSRPFPARGRRWRSATGPRSGSSSYVSTPMEP